MSGAVFRWKGGSANILPPHGAQGRNSLGLTGGGCNGGEGRQRQGFWGVLPPLPLGGLGGAKKVTTIYKNPSEIIL